MFSDGHGKFTPGKKAADFVKLNPDQFNMPKLETQDSTRAKIGLDPIDEATRNMARRIAEKKERELFDAIGGHLKDAGDQYIGRPYNEDELKKLTDVMMNGVAKASGIPTSALGADVASSNWGGEVKITVDTLNKIPKRQLIMAVLNQMNTLSTPGMIDAVESYIERHGKSIFDGFGNEPEEEPDDFLGEMKQELLSIHGVTGVQPMLDNYPDYASIIVKINMSKFDDEDVDQYMGQIDSVIQTLKPKGLMELEVIYHNKVVY